MGKEHVNLGVANFKNHIVSSESATKPPCLSSKFRIQTFN